MKRFLLLVFIAAGLLVAWAQPVVAQEPTPVPKPSPFGDPLCQPEKYYRAASGDCLDFGPSTYLRRIKNAAVTFDAPPFRYEVLDPSYFNLDVRYMEVRKDIQKNMPVYGSMQDVGKKSAAISSISTYFSYITYQDVVDKKYVLTNGGTWVARGDVSPVAPSQAFRGLIFPYTPPTDFGWTFLETVPRSAPGYANPEVPEAILATNTVVQVFETQVVDGNEWDRVGPDLWVEGRLVNKVTVNTNPPEGVDNGRWIEVNLAEQTLSVYDNRRLVFAAIVATGEEPLFTRPGLFPIYEKHDTTLMQGATLADRSDFYYLEDVPWTMYFDKARALHGAYWRAKLGFPQSHGCVNLSVGDAHWIYDWANVGDWVYVWDPSGKTPTDPGFYGDGGA
jgi:lipoprotein-anchoring transpeptidase ErfK/SrfK